MRLLGMLFLLSGRRDVRLPSSQLGTPDELGGRAQRPALMHVAASRMVWGRGGVRVLSEARGVARLWRNEVSLDSVSVAGTCATAKVGGNGYGVRCSVLLSGCGADGRAGNGGVGEAAGKLLSCVVRASASASA